MSILPFQYIHRTLELIFNPTWQVISIFGVFSNMMNILVFLKSGVKDNVTVLLLCLSASDFCFLALISPYIATALIVNFSPSWNWKFDINIPLFLFYWPAFAFYDFSAYVSVFLGVTRCACVTFPLHFKSVFTKSGTIIIVVALFISTILLRIPVLSIFSIGTKLNPSTNHTYVYFKRHSNRNSVLVDDTLNRTSLPWVAFIIMVGCVIILSVKLIEASKVRQPARSVGNGINNSQNGQGQQVSNKYKMSAKESHVVQSVVQVCVIFILSQLPFLLYTTARLIYPEFDRGKKLNFLFGICTQISLTCSFLNASVNIIIYYNYNSRYRCILKSLFCSSSTKS